MADANLSPGMAVGSNGSVMTSKFSGRVLTAAVIFIFLMVIFAIFLYIYWKNKWIPGIATHGRAHFIITADDTTIARRGLGAAVLPSLPLAIFRRSGFKDGIECSVCLCELCDGDEFRLLPKCSHGFHVDCIDMWLHSHLTCPLCRCPVGPEAAAAGELSPATDGGQPSSRSPVLPTSVLLWRNNGRFSTRGLLAHSERSLVITIPNRFADGLEMPMNPLGSGCCSGENLKSPAEESRSAGTSKLESLRRMLSRGKRSGGSSCSSPVEGDVEKGVVRCEKEEVGSSNVSKAPVSNSVRSFPSLRSKLEY